MYHYDISSRKPLRLTALALPVCHIQTPWHAKQVWTEKGVVYGGIPNGLVHGEASFVIPKPQPDLVIGPYQKGDDSKIFIYPIDALLVRCCHLSVLWPVI